MIRISALPCFHSKPVAPPFHRLCHTPSIDEGSAGSIVGVGVHERAFASFGDTSSCLDANA
jgi:hypothetical protein